MFLQTLTRPTHVTCLSLLASLIIFCSLLVFQRSHAQGTPATLEDYQVPSNLSALNFYLITVDVGDQVWDNFGHTALRVFDENTNTDVIFNWGTFDTSGGVVDFSWKFFKGIMDYRLTTSTPSQEFSLYSAQQRTVWQDKLNLTNPQKERLYRRLLWNLESSNTAYAYEYFFNNCTTKVRDYLDESLSGALLPKFSRTTEFSFRDHVRSHYQSVGLVEISLNILMNSNIDRKISEWEEMFLPLKFRERLLQVESDVAENGERQMLLSDSQIIAQFMPPTIDTNPYEVVFYLLTLPVVFLFFMIRKIPQTYYATRSQIGLRFPRLNYRVLALLGAVTSLFSGTLGLLMLGSWFLSGHTDTHHNINLLVFWPTDIFGIIVATGWLVSCKAWPTNHNTAPFINYYLFGHLVAMLIYGLIGFFGLSEQKIDDILYSILLGFFSFTILICIVGFEPSKPRNVLL